MYADNKKIASRQTFRLYVFDLMGIATLLLPPYLTKLCGVDGVFAIVLGTGAGFLYLLYLGWIMKRMKTDICSFLRQESYIGVEKITYTWVALHSIVTAGFCAYVFANLMQYSLIREMSFEIILLVILVVAAYAVNGGIESRARVYEVLFWFVLIPYVAMMIASIRNFKMSYLEGFVRSDLPDFLKGVYLVFLLTTPLFYSLFLIGEKEKNYGCTMIKTVSASLLLSAGILVGSYLILIGNFGAKALGTMRYPVVTLMSTIQFKGNFLKRMDALMLAVWFFTLYALLNLHLHYGVNMFQQLFASTRKQEKWKVASVVMPTIGAFVVAWLLENSKNALWTFLNYYSYAAVPVMLIGPAVLLVLRKKKGVSHE